MNPKPFLAILGVAASHLATAQVVHKSFPLDCGGWFSGFAVHSSGRLYGYGDVFGFWRSDNVGKSWRYLQGDLTVDDNFVNGGHVATGDANKVAFLTPSRLWRSNDGGTSWTAALTDLASRRDRGAMPVFFHPGNDDEIWLATSRAGMSGTLWRSTNGGTTWAKLGGSTFDAAVATTVYVRPEFPNQILVGTQGALFASADRGVTWSRVWNNGGANNPFTGKPSVVRAIVRRPDGVGYVATDVGGYRLSAADWGNPSTYSLAKTLSWWDGWGPSNATVLADGSFVSGGDGNGAGPTDPQDRQQISSDGGVTWTPLALNLVTPPSPIYQPAGATKAPGGRDMIVQDPTVPSRWFMTGGFAPVVSNDSGATWRYFPNTNGLAGLMTYKVRFARANRRTAYIPSSDKGAFVVNDGGTSRNARFCSNASIDRLFTIHEVMPSDDGATIVAAGVDQVANRTMIQRSRDGGATWTALDLSASGLPTSFEGVTKAVMAPGNPDDFLVLLGAGGGFSNPGLWRTRDGGARFTQVNGIPAGLDTGMRYHPENAHLETDGVNVNVRYLSIRGNRLYRSTDGGSNWSVTSSMPFGTDWIHSFSVDRASAGRLWAAGAWRGLARSSDGGDTWTTLTGFSDASHVDAANGRVAVWGRRAGDTWKKIYFSADNGLTWTERTGPGFRYAHLRDLAVDPWTPGRIWISGISVNTVEPPVGRRSGLKSAPPKLR